MSDETKTDDGGPAFPCPNDANVNGDTGMSLRDYFAAKAMQGILAGDAGCDLENDEVASDAYLMADAMLAARKQVQP